MGFEGERSTQPIGPGANDVQCLLQSCDMFSTDFIVAAVVSFNQFLDVLDDLIESIDRRRSAADGHGMLFLPAVAGDEVMYRGWMASVDDMELNPMVPGFRAVPGAHQPEFQGRLADFGACDLPGG